MREIEEVQEIEGNQEVQEAQGDAQAEEGYLCSCGFKTINLIEFRKHIFLKSREEGKGSHTSEGRVNMLTGEITMPPWKDRTLKQKQLSKYGKKTKSNGDGAKLTSVLSSANQLRLIPRVYTCDYTPVMRAAQVAATQKWGWREDMPLDNFIDTCISIMFRDRGIVLAGYIDLNEGGFNNGS